MFKILSYPNENLKTICEKVEIFDQELHHLLDQMQVIMEQNNGMGLAAPQVGLKSRMFIMKDLKGKLWEFINPIIKFEDGIQYEDEGCLSFNNVAVQIKRPKQISVQAFNRNGEEFFIGAIDKEAVCISHEIDHLDGVLLIDHMTRQQRRDFLKRVK